MIDKPTKRQVCEAMDRLTANADWINVATWLRTEHGKLLELLAETNDDISLRQRQGAAQAVKVLLVSFDEAHETARKLRE